MHNSLSKIMSLTGQTSVAHGLGGFREVSPPERVHSLSDHNCTVVGEGQKTLKTACAREPGRGKQLPWVSNSPDCSLIL